MIYLGVDFFGFLSNLWICRFMSFIKFTKFSAIISVNTFFSSTLFLLSLPLGLQWYKFFMIDPQVPESPFTLFSIYFFSNVQIESSLFICLQVHSFYPVISSLLLSLSSELLNFGCCIFQCYNFHLILFYNFFFLAEIFYYLFLENL